MQPSLASDLNLQTPYSIMEPHVETPGVTSKPQPRRPRRAEDWEDLKPVITEMYARKELKSVMKEMEEHHSFKATYVLYQNVC